MIDHHGGLAGGPGPRDRLDGRAVQAAVAEPALAVRGDERQDVRVERGPG